MNPDRLLRHFDRIAEAPDAVPRLRRFILDLAVRGKLVEQDPSDEPATELLKRIAAEKTNLAERGEIRSLKQSAPIQPEELPFEIPRSWAWIRLRDLGRLSGGMTPSKDRTDYWNGDLVWLSPKDIKADEITSSELRITPKGLSETRLELFPVGSVFMVARSGILKRTFPVAINRVPAASNQDLKVLVPYLEGSERYLQIMLRGLEDFILRVLVKTGTTVQSLKYAEFEVQPFPFPPLAEQHRIVAKVDELMALCDRLEAAQREREQRRDRLVAASLRQLQDKESLTRRHEGTKEEKEANEKNLCAFAPSREPVFLRDIPRLTTRHEHIKALRQTILNLAVCGRLVPQDPNDESATKLLERLKASKIAAYASENLRARPPIAPPARQRARFNFPWSWELASFDDVFVIVSGVTKGQKIPWNEAIQVPYLRVANVQRGWLDLKVIKTLAVRLEDKERYNLKKNDILMTEGGDWDKLGRAAIWRNEIAECIHQNHIFRVRPPSQEILSEWVTGYVNSPLGRGYFEDASKQTTNLASINLTQLRACPLPIPPLAEQHRIVAKVDELMAVCDQLEAQLASTQTDSRRLLEAVLHEALA